MYQTYRVQLSTGPQALQLITLWSPMFNVYIYFLTLATPSDVGQYLPIHIKAIIYTYTLNQ
jgi:hypothetical protein